MPAIPSNFKTKMNELLLEEYPSFIQSYLSPKTLALRVNNLKLSPAQFQALSHFQLRKVPWAEEGFYYSESDRPGKHPYHSAGLYYIQEPSAMAVCPILDPQPGEKVLDLCAAPGGKSTHIAARLNGQGVLVANEFTPNRAKILAENMERVGVTNAVILNERPQKLAQRFSGFFDRILVDAPCSGEGMFRKDPAACSEWSLENAARCSERQGEILAAAIEMLGPGGSLVYSTCTFSPEENEQIIERLMEHYPNLELIPPPSLRLFSPGRPEWSKSGNAALANTVRIWPHKAEGEGHFIALLKSDLSHLRRKNPPSRNANLAPKESVALWQKFASENLPKLEKQGTFIQFADHLYLSPEGLPDLSGIKVVRPGWHLGVLKKNRFEPSHALALGLKPDQTQKSLKLTAQDQNLFNYLKGESIRLAGDKGWNLLCVDDYPIGWGKHDGSSLKNHYPKGLRWNY